MQDLTAIQRSQQRALTIKCIRAIRDILKHPKKLHNIVNTFHGIKWYSIKSWLTITYQTSSLISTDLLSVALAIAGKKFSLKHFLADEKLWQFLTENRVQILATLTTLEPAINSFLKQHSLQKLQYRQITDSILIAPSNLTALLKALAATYPTVKEICYYASKLLEQNEILRNQLGENRNIIATKVEQYFATSNAIYKLNAQAINLRLLKIIGPLLSQPQALVEINKHYQQSAWLSLTETLFDYIGNNQELKNFLISNHDILNNSLKSSAKLHGSFINDKLKNLRIDNPELLELILILLNYPAECKHIIYLLKERSYLPMAQAIVKTIQDNLPLQRFITAHADSIAAMLENLLHYNENITNFYTTHGINIKQREVIKNILLNINSVNFGSPLKSFKNILTSNPALISWVIESVREHKSSARHSTICQNYDHQRLRDVTFSDCTLQDCSFQHTVFRNVNFVNNITFQGKISFFGADLDPTTLTSLSKVIHRLQNVVGFTHITLDGIRLTGDFSSLDLRGISLKGADFSKAIVKNVILTDSNIEGSNISQTQLESAEDIQGIKWDGDFAKIQTNQEQGKIAQQIAIHIAPLPLAQIPNFNEILTAILTEHPKIGPFLREYYNDQAHLNSPFYASFRNGMGIAFQKDKESLASAFNSHIDNIIFDRLANNLNHELFSDTTGKRTKDSNMIKAHLRSVLCDIKRENPTLDFKALVEKEDLLIGNLQYGLTGGVMNSAYGLARIYYDYSSYTYAGLITGGICIKANTLAKNTALTKAVTQCILSALSERNVSQHEINIIQSLATKIAINIFGNKNLNTKAATTLKTHFTHTVTEFLKADPQLSVSHLESDYAQYNLLRRRIHNREDLISLYSNAASSNCCGTKSKLYAKYLTTELGHKIQNFLRPSLIAEDNSLSERYTSSYARF